MGWRARGSKIQISELCKQNAGPEPCIDLNSEAAEIVGQLNRVGCGAVFVLSESRHLIGIITDGDIRRALGTKKSISSLSANELMSQGPITVTLDVSIVDAHRLMLINEVNVLPVVDCNGTYLSYVQLMDFQSHLSPERIYPIGSNKSDEDNELRHFSRYEFASSFITRNSQILDCACGSGYGSALLAKKATSVLGIDRSTDAIAFADTHFNKPNIQFRQDDIANLEFADNTFDAVVSLETLEHVPREVCEEYLGRIVRWLKPGGILVCSSPMLRYRNGSPYITNPYHINELPRDQLLTMLNSHQEHLDIQFFHQKEETFQPLLDEHTGFCIVIARKRMQQQSVETNHWVPQRAIG